ncbi:alpha/beta hydrolase [Brevibacillus dissolubilis]|uniref:alpha/beta hydrolase n=1 Tax=Brevibacillus dissolubilis TaxID=1844116 RepID=UPI001117A3A9|nr:alpha/beta hydrolase [Brevibacillus dissolubilis]
MSTWLWIVIILLIVAVGVMVGIAVKVGLTLIRPPRKPIEMDPARYGLPHYENVIFPSRDADLQLSGWYMDAEWHGYPSNGHTIVVSHGYRQNRQEPHLPALALVTHLVAAGFDVLMYDFRNAGESEGNMTSIGLYEQLDLRGAIDFACIKKPGHRIGLIGFSMGSVTSLLVAGQDERVEAVVADSPFYSLYEYLQENMPVWTGLPSFPFTWLILSIVPFLVGASPRKVRPIDEVKRFSPKPILFIHGTGDKAIPHHHSEKLYEAAANPHNEVFLVEGADHVRSFARQPKEYSERVITFFQEKMVGKA